MRTLLCLVIVLCFLGCTSFPGNKAIDVDGRLAFDVDWLFVSENGQIFTLDNQPIASESSMAPKGIYRLLLRKKSGSKKWTVLRAYFLRNEPEEHWLK